MEFLIKYTQEKSGIHAYVTSIEDEPKTWDHYLSTDEALLLSTDPHVLDAQLTLIASQQPVFVPIPDPVVEPPFVPSNVRISDAVDVTTTNLIIDTFNATKQAINAGLADLMEKAAKLPIEKRAVILQQAHDAVDLELSNL